MVNFKSLAFLFTLGVSNVLSQEQLLFTPLELWSNQVFSTVSTEVGVGKGNGVTLSPDGAHVIVTSIGGTVTSFSSLDGQVEWEYEPPQPAGGIVRSHSQAVFTTNATVPYMVYAVVENENSADAVGRVIALDMDGTELWVSGDLDGVPSGSPAVSSDGSYVFLTHNANFETIGFFTILSAVDGAEFYSASNQTTPFSPLGIFHQPYEGYYDYDNGRGNTNDLLMWSMQPKPEDTTIGVGQLFAFQFPVATTGANSTVGYFLMGEEPRSFQSITAPTITNQGLSAYFSTSRSNFYGWYGTTTSPRGRFNRGPQAVAGFTRNSLFAGQPVFASPAVSNGVATLPIEPVIFGGTAAPEFVRLNYNFTEQVVVPTSSLIKAEARVDPFDRVVYFAEESGTLHQVDFATIQDIWVYNASNTVEGELALNPKGSILYIADSTGLVTALQVSNLPVTVAPTAAPTANVTESLAPSVGTVAETPAPTPAPTAGEDTPEPTVGSEAEAPTVAPAPAPAPDSGSSQPMIFISIVSMVLCLFW